MVNIGNFMKSQMPMLVFHICFCCLAGRSCLVNRVFFFLFAGAMAMSRHGNVLQLNELQIFLQLP